MKKIFLAAIFLISVFGLIGVITAKANSEHDQTLLDEAFKAVRAAPAAQLTDAERAQLICRGKLHACFHASDLELEAFLQAIAQSRDPQTACSDACSSVDTPACSIGACTQRCFIAAGGDPGALSCPF